MHILILLECISLAKAQAQSISSNGMMYTSPIYHSSLIEVPYMYQPSYTPVQTDYPYFDKNHTCYNCIMNDAIFCLKNNTTAIPSTLIIKENQEGPESVCCKNYFDCPQLNDPQWQCSLSFSDKNMALRMCPQKEVSCGNSSQLFFSAVNQNFNVNVSLGPGEVCIYDVRAECGVPSFFPDG